MPRVLIFILAAIALAGRSAPALAQAATTPEPSVIVTSGDAVLLRPADRAFVRIGAEGRAPRPAEAQQIAAGAMTGVQTALKRLGLPGDAIKTTAYIVQPEFDYRDGRQVFRAYLARNVVEVRVDDLAKLGAVLDAAGTSGATTIAGLRWELKNSEAVELEALRLAVKDATERAQAMAAGAGRTLGPILRIEEQRMSSPGPVLAFAAAESAREARVPTPVEAGEIQVRAQVSLTIGIK